MTSKVATEQSTLDTVKLATAAILLSTAVIAFYYYADASKLVRIGGLLAATAVAAGVSLRTEKGRQLAGFIKEAQVEVRKVIWPTRPETVQTTMVVIVVVIIVALFLWVLDWGLGGIVRWVMGHKS